MHSGTIRVDNPFVLECVHSVRLDVIRTAGADRDGWLGTVDKYDNAIAGGVGFRLFMLGESLGDGEKILEVRKTAQVSASASSSLLLCGFMLTIPLRRLSVRSNYLSLNRTNVFLRLGPGRNGSSLLGRKSKGHHNFRDRSHSFLHVIHGDCRINSINRSQQPIREQLTSGGLRNPIVLILLDHDLHLGIRTEDLDWNVLSQGNKRKIWMSTTQRTRK